MRVTVGDDAAAVSAMVALHTATRVKHRELCCNSPVLISIFLTKKFDAFVDFNVLLATDVRGLELVIRHELNC